MYMAIRFFIWVHVGTKISKCLKFINVFINVFINTFIYFYFIYFLYPFIYIHSQNLIVL